MSRQQQTCSDCGKQSPSTDTNYTLISASYGWRLTREVDANGSAVTRWRCPVCWQKHKERRATG